MANAGASDQANVLVRVFASEDDELDGSDTLLGSKAVRKVKAGKRKGLKANLPIASDALMATHHLIVVVDHQDLVPESREGNNRSMVPPSAWVPGSLKKGPW